MKALITVEVELRADWLDVVARDSGLPRMALTAGVAARLLRWSLQRDLNDGICGLHAFHDPKDPSASVRVTTFTLLDTETR